MMQFSEPQISDVQRVLALKSFPAFADIPARDLSMLAAHFRAVHYEPAETIVPSGSPPTKLYLLISGTAALYEEGRKLEPLDAGGIVGGLAALGSAPFKTSAVAETPTTTLEIRYGALEELLEDNYSLLLSMLQSVARESIDLRRRKDPLVVSARPGDVTAGPNGNTEPDSKRMTFSERVRLLRRTAPLSDLRLEVITSLAQDGTEIRLIPGARLWSEEELLTDCVVVASGSVLCRPSTSSTFSAGPTSILGMLECLSRLPVWHGAEAAEPATALRLHRAQLIDALEDHTEMALHILQFFARRVLSQRADLRRRSGRVRE